MKVLYFGVLSEIAGKSEEEMYFSGQISELKIRLNESYPDFRNQRFQVSLNQEIANDDQKVNEGDEIALLPPFTGG